MFGKRRTEELQQILASAQMDRELYAEQAARDRAMFMEQLISAKVPNAPAAGEIQQLLENAQKDRELYAEQAAHDRAMLVAQLDANRLHNVPAVVAMGGANDNPVIRKGQELKAAYALNLCTVSVSQIVDYNDLIIMEQEYEAILNNLNLENFPKDEALLKILKQILDVIAFFRIQAEEKKLQEEEYKKRVKDAVWSAVPSPTTILAGGSAGWVGLAVGAVMAVGTSYMNYRRERSNIDMEQRRKDWELQRSAMEQFDGLRRELFDTAWRLADKYEFDDKYRLTSRQISQYNKMLEDPDPLRRYERLFYVKDNFVAYPPFWYYLGHAAAEVATKTDINGYLCYPTDIVDDFREKAISAYQLFLSGVDDNVHKNLLREDQTCAACALELFSLVANDPAFPRAEKIKLLEKAAKNAGNAFDTLQMCATSYLAIGEVESGLRLMNMLVNEGYNEDMNAQILAMMYVNGYLRGDAENKARYLTLSARVGERIPLLPMPGLTDCNTTELSAKFISDQCNYLLNNYRDTLCEYIVQCSVSFQKIMSKPGDVSAEIIDFVRGVEQDMSALFLACDAKRVCKAILTAINEALSKRDNRDILSNRAQRTDNQNFTFEAIFTGAFLLVAEIIKGRINNIVSANDNEKMHKISEFAGQLLLFKQSKKIYGSSIAKGVDESEDDPYEILRKTSEDNNLIQKCNATIVRFLSDDSNMIVAPSKKKTPSRFYTQRNSAEISDYVASRKGIPAEASVIAVLDTSARDLIFTPTGIVVPRKFHDSKEVPYGNINLIKGALRIGDVMFECDDVDNSALERLINALSATMPSTISNSCVQAFNEKLTECTASAEST